MGTVELYGCAAAAVLAVVTVLWIASVAMRDASIIDAFWGPLFVAIAWVLLAVNLHTAGLTHLLVVFLVTVWGLRLAFHLAARNFGNGEDVRYRLWRAHGGELWWLKTYYRVYLLQGAIALVVATPIVAAFRVTDAPFPINWIGVPVWLVGFVVEATADVQLTRFRNDPDNQGRVMQDGLWSYSAASELLRRCAAVVGARHPHVQRRDLVVGDRTAGDDAGVPEYLQRSH